jgi:hypothetical protein
MSYARNLVGIAFLACSAAAQGSATEEVVRDAQLMADCAKALDATCVIELSDVASYELIAPPEAHFHFAKSQSRFYAALRRNGFQYTRFDVYAPTNIFSGDGRLYAFVPYIYAEEAPGQSFKEHRAFFIAISTDSGSSWKFVDGDGISTDNLRKIIPSYSGQPLPIAHFE